MAASGCPSPASSRRWCRQLTSSGRPTPLDRRSPPPEDRVRASAAPPPRPSAAPLTSGLAARFAAGEAFSSSPLRPSTQYGTLVLTSVPPELPPHPASSRSSLPTHPRPPPLEPDPPHADVDCHPPIPGDAATHPVRPATHRVRLGGLRVPAPLSRRPPGSGPKHPQSPNSSALARFGPLRHASRLCRQSGHERTHCAKKRTQWPRGSCYCRLCRLCHLWRPYPPHIRLAASNILSVYVLRIWLPVDGCGPPCGSEACRTRK